jgi:hypothetical protein
MKKTKDTETEIRDLEQKVRAAREKASAITNYLNSLALPASRGEATSIALQREQRVELETAQTALRDLDAALSQAVRERDDASKAAVKAEADHKASANHDAVKELHRKMVDVATSTDKHLAAASAGMQALKDLRSELEVLAPGSFAKLNLTKIRMTYPLGFHKFNEHVEFANTLPPYNLRRPLSDMVRDAIALPVVEQKAS